MPFLTAVGLMFVVALVATDIALVLHERRSRTADDGKHWSRDKLARFDQQGDYDA